MRWCVKAAFFLNVIILFFLITAQTATSRQRKKLRQEQEEEEVDDCSLQYAPYLASIRDVKGNHHCGAVVISEDAVLTSAACVDRRLTTNLASRPRIHISGTDSNNPKQKRQADKIFIHQKWDGKKQNGYDLAIVKLNKPICAWPVRYIGRREKEQFTFLAFGYGRTGSTGVFAAGNLHGGNVTFIPRSECNKQFDLPDYVGWDHICFQGSTGGGGLCIGDEGGPIMHAPFSPVYQDSLIAIASYTVGDCDDNGSVAIAMNVRKFRGWINSTLESEEYKSTLE